MTTYQLQPPAGLTTNKAGPGPGQSPKTVIRQMTLTAALASGDILVGPAVQGGAIITNAYKVNGPAGNLGTPSSASAFATTPFTPYVVPDGGENVQLVATAAGGAANDVVSIVVHYLPKNA